MKSLLIGIEVDECFIEVQYEIMLVGGTGRGQERRSGHFQYLPFQLSVDRTNVL